jgi:hypothetical protein
MQSCPTCSAPRDGALRFCPACGLDYWRAAAGDAEQRDPTPPPAARPATRLPALMVVAGVTILIAVSVTAVIMSGLVPIAGVGSRPAATPRQLTPEEAVVYAFFREVRDPRAEYSLTTEATTTFNGLEVEIPPVNVTNEIRIYRDDWAGTERVTDDEATTDYEAALVDGVVYLSEDGGDWESKEIPERLHPISPFRRISTVTEVDYLESTTFDGATQHTLVITKWLGGRDYSDILRRFARIVSQESRMEVTVDSFGVPSIAELDVTVVATDGVDTLTIEAHATYRFADWDDVEPIDSPLEPDDPSS